MVRFVLLAAVFQQPWVLAALLLIQIIGLATKGKFNLFVSITKPFLRTEGREEQGVELTRFNNSLAILFLTMSLPSFALGWIVAGYVFATFLFVAASVALLSYSIGCTL
ncbi:DUF4395 family protein [Paenibacillus algorifonticola]|uniref:DUF4395 family protein n=1 Tax=Paenibacillus algorifonticola TaxID=684063 RepID=UPI000945DFA0|nr:DUF4395 family protein [Paenibacillus algorifonticola]